MLPQKYLDRVSGRFERLVVFKGSLALIVFGYALVDNRGICQIWVMKEYGVAEFWTKNSVPMERVPNFLGTVNGEFLIEKLSQIHSFEHESVNKKILRIPRTRAMIYTNSIAESLVLLW
jgi:hypothetical protein